MEIPAGAKKVQLVLASTAQGSVHALLGSSDLGTKTIVTGQNLLTFVVPDGVSDTLTLTPLATDGTTAGSALSVKLMPEPSTSATQRAVKKTKTQLKKIAKRRAK
jgi:hypothetical protein